MSVEDGDVLPSSVDPDYECVPVRALDDGSPAEPPPGGQPEPGSRRLCPDGYVPRRKRQAYELDGKVIRRSTPPERNPGAEGESGHGDQVDPPPSPT